MSEQLSAPRLSDAVADASPRRRSWRVAKWIAIAVTTLAIVAVVAGAGVAYATYDYAAQYEGRILPRSEIAGVDVSGMTRADALEAVKAAVRPDLQRQITVRYKGRRWTVTPKRLGAHSDARRAVHAALLASADTSFFDKMKMRILGEELNFEQAVDITYPRAEVRNFVGRLASDVNLKPRDASIDYSTGWVEFSDERNGRKVKVAQARTEMMTALHRDRARVALPVDVLEPDVTSAAYDQVLLVRIGENKLYLYQNGSITHSWPVATGQPEYMTPTGMYEITEKRYLPTWINPAPTTWGADMPAEIPPGPDNPLGLRALNWSAPAIRFHGTEATYSLGYNASHGCVRLSNSDVIELYNMVDVGTPIVSLVAGSLNPLYVSSPDPTPVADNQSDGKKGNG
jgi:lipoprotein-anchoring transpeptidase ErfK/SrfK